MSLTLYKILYGRTFFLLICTLSIEAHYSNLETLAANVSPSLLTFNPSPIARAASLPVQANLLVNTPPSSPNRNGATYSSSVSGGNNNWNNDFNQGGANMGSGSYITTGNSNNNNNWSGSSNNNNNWNNNNNNVATWTGNAGGTWGGNAGSSSNYNNPNGNSGGSGGNSNWYNNKPQSVPWLPMEAKMMFRGVYPTQGFTSQGFWIYSSSRLLWRIDELYQFENNAFSRLPNQAGMAEFNFLINQNNLKAYRFDPVQFYWTCNNVQLDNFWRRDYLTQANYMGTNYIGRQQVYVYVNTGLWRNTNVKTYVSTSTMKILRIYFDTPTNAFYYDFDAIVDMSSSYNWGNAFKIPDGLVQVPCV